ncbi:MAG: BREX system Lon protease-like protein BrxL, partial [bacterium]
PKMSPSLFTDHFGLVSDFLSECWSRLRSDSRIAMLRGRVEFGGALSGRDLTAVNHTINALLKLLYPSPEMEISDTDLEWAVRLSLECRRRVKEQQKRIGSAEFRNTHFSYRLGSDAMEIFVSTPELASSEGIGSDPLPSGHVWGIGPGGQDEGAGLYRIEVNAGQGSGVRITNVGASGLLRESVQTAYQNLLARNRELIGDREAKQMELNVQIRAMDSAKSGGMLGAPILIAFCSAILEKSVRGGWVIVGGLSVGGSFEPLYNAVSIAEMAVEKGAQTILLPVASRRQLNDLSDEMAAKLTIVYYTDARDALMKCLVD